MKSGLDRRSFLKGTAQAAAGIGLASLAPQLASAASQNKEPAFKISLAEWSLHVALQKKQMSNLDFPKAAKEEYGIDAVEYVNQFFKDKANDKAYLTELKKRCDDLGVRSVLIMCDGEGALGDADEKRRTKAVENHYRWVEAAKFLGCHSIRVNAQSSGSYEEQMERAANGLHKLCEFGDKHDINVIVENHGGLSSNGAWLAATIKKADHPRCGTLPDFGNFRVSRTEEYDRYKGTAELMPFAKGVSAKSYDFDASGNETTIDFPKMMKIVLGAGYKGFVGVEYEGNRLSEPEGIKATKRLLERIRDAG